jgi:anti-anti-sigma regulatory factor
MRSSEAEESCRQGWGLEELQLLAALGFGPDSALMSDPKLFVDGPFLSALQSELVCELGEEEAARTFFHIGLIHGLRDAARIGNAEPGVDGVVGILEAPPLAMRLGPSGATDEKAGIALAGSWPEHFEAEARLGKLGVSRAACCSLSAGYTSGWLSGTLERDVVVRELSCRAAGDASCSFVAQDEHRARQSGSTRSHLPIAAVRAVALAPGPGSAPGDRSHVDTLPTQIDPDDPAVHIWGPVMVMPFTHPEAAMQTVEMLTRDEATRAVRVVVLDLGGCMLDEAFGAAALEHVIDAMQSWGAEVVLTGISPLSEEVVAQLQAALMLTRKDLSEAIAYAFQIADAQRHLL